MRTDARRPRTEHPARPGILFPWLIVAALVVLGYLPMLPPGPVPSDAPDSEFSAARAMEHVRVIARGPHPMGTDANASVRAYIVERLEALGIEVQLQTITASDYYGGGAPVPVVNVVARIPGEAGTRAVALMGHYDTVPTTPGANDDTAAVASLLETGRALLAGPRPANDVLLLFTDAEEPAPKFGSSGFVRAHPAFPDIGLVVNLEATGGSGASLLVEASGPEEWLIGELASADSRPAGFSFLTSTARLLGNIGTDFDTFRNAGLTGFHFAYMHGSPIYHSAADDIDSVSPGSLQHHGAHALSIARHFGGIDLGRPPPSGAAVYFPVGPLFARYSTAWGVSPAILAAALFVVGAATRIRRHRIGAVALIRSLGRTVGVGLLVALLGTVAWLGIVAVRTTPGVAESYLYFLAILAATACLAASLAGGRREIEIGILLLWVALAALTTFGLPGFGYLFAWPALAATVTFLWRPGPSVTRRTVRFLLVAVPTLLLVIPAIDVFFQFAQPRPGNPDSQMAAAVAVPLLLALLSGSLIRTAWPRARREEGPRSGRMSHLT